MEYRSRRSATFETARFAVDTALHRIWECSDVQAVEAKSAVARNNFIAGAVTAKPVSLLVLGGVQAELPGSVTTCVRFIGLGSRGIFAEFEVRDGSAIFEGSCTDPACRTLARASWTAVQRHEHGVVTRTAYGNGRFSPFTVRCGGRAWHIPLRGQASEEQRCFPSSDLSNRLVSRPRQSRWRGPWCAWLSDRFLASPTTPRPTKFAEVVHPCHLGDA